MDRITVTPEAFLEHVAGAEAVRERFYPDLPSEAFQRYILAWRIRSEFTTGAGWRRQLSAELAPVLGNTTDASVASRNVLDWVRRKTQLLGPTRAYPLGLKGDLDPLTTLRGGRGSEIDISILAVAALRSVGIASRLVYAPVIAGEEGGKVWIEYRAEKKWNPWVASAPAGAEAKRWLQAQFVGKWGFIVANPADPVNVTNEYAPVGALWMAPKPLTVERFEATAMILSDGRLQSVMARDIYNSDPKDSQRGIGLQGYIIGAGDRQSAGGVKRVLLNGPGWYQFDFEHRAQQFTVSKSKPAYFEWDTEEANAAAPTDAW